MPEAVPQLAALILAACLTWAALAKAVRLGQWQTALAAFRLDPGLARIASLGVPATELGCSVVLVGVHAKAGAAATLALLSGFCLAILRARALQGDRVPCGCFGRAAARDYRTLLARNFGLGVIASAVLLSDLDHGALQAVEAPAPSELVPAALVVAGVVLIGWMALGTAEDLRRKERR